MRNLNNYKFIFSINLIMKTFDNIWLLVSLNLLTSLNLEVVMQIFYILTFCIFAIIFCSEKIANIIKFGNYHVYFSHFSFLRICYIFLFGKDFLKIFLFEKNKNV